jgi:hypothetical protein
VHTYTTLKFLALQGAPYIYILYNISRLRVNELIKSRRMMWAGCVACMGENQKAYVFYMVKFEGLSPLGRHRHGWEDNTVFKCFLHKWDKWRWTGFMTQVRDKWWAVVNIVVKGF